MDTANLPRDHMCYVAERKKIPGLFSDETDGRTMYEFVALRAKSYAYIVESQTTIKAKGVRRHVPDNHLTFDEHKKCLFAVAPLNTATAAVTVHDNDNDNDSQDPLQLSRENVSIRSFKHQVKTIKTMKLTLNGSDDKRFVLEDCVHTYAHGHYKIPI